MKQFWLLSKRWQIVFHLYQLKILWWMSPQCYPQHSWTCAPASQLVARSLESIWNDCNCSYHFIVGIFCYQKFRVQSLKTFLVSLKTFCGVNNTATRNSHDRINRYKTSATRFDVFQLNRWSTGKHRSFTSEKRYSKKRNRKRDHVQSRLQRR